MAIYRVMSQRLPLETVVWTAHVTPKPAEDLSDTLGDYGFSVSNILGFITAHTTLCTRASIIRFLRRRQLLCASKCA